ncbi:MAG TPA: alcohol dehydrogenase catalytic domain-containing protein [Candidatus Limnocylindrales bacterium]|nr:alcohol dehydrogenase catalytic domain-containing protein [Candidatus Limnocylindrales bacterium]
MKAVVAHGAADFRLEDVPEPGLDGGALIAIAAAGVCAADRMIYAGTSPWELSFPFTPGHENAGTVLEIDARSAARWGVDVGDLVVPEVMVPCGRCAMCRRERFHLCRDGRHIGSSLHGGWAERVWLPPEARVWRVPDGLAPEEAVVAEPLACAIHAIERADPGPDDALVISGIGAIGAAALAYVSAARPVRDVVALVTTPERGAVARELGASEAIDVRNSDAAAVLRDRFDGIGPDIYVDFSGQIESVDLGLEAIVPGGRLTLYGVYRRRASVDWNTVAEFKELEIRGGHLAPTEFGTALQLLATHAVDGRRLVTASYPLDEFQAALDEPRDGALMTLKTILLPPRAAPAAGAAGSPATGEDDTR